MFKQLHYLQKLYSGSFYEPSPEYLIIKAEVTNIQITPRMKEDKMSLKSDFVKVLSDTNKAKTYYGRKKKNKS